VFDYAQSRRLPVAVAMAGGYCPRIEEIVQVHLGTVAAALAVYLRSVRPADE